MLTNIALKEIKTLQQQCERADQIKLKLNWDMLKSGDKETNALLHYDNGELIGFLGIYGFGNKVELCGMVKPDHRRKGVFAKLFTQAIQSVQKQNTEILLNAPANSQMAKGFLKSVICRYLFSEYQMQWKETDLADNQEVSLRPATAKDLEAEIQLDVQCFGLNEADAREYISLRKSREANGHFIIEEDGKTVGKIRVSHSDGEAWIYGFCVFPQYQGKGIGRRALIKVILQESQKGFPIFLEVEAKNAHALRLYESCGFNSYYSQDYYRFQPLKD